MVIIIIHMMISFLKEREGENSIFVFMCTSFSFHTFREREKRCVKGHLIFSNLFLPYCFLIGLSLCPP